MRKTGKDGGFHVHFTVPTNKKMGGVRSLLERKERERTEGRAIPFENNRGGAEVR